ncbi:MAG TPA: VOC family protein [Burkholderiaceae bacterium]|nr:VOC family protein [Burkholderiaceae bacterium]
MNANASFPIPAGSQHKSVAELVVGIDHVAVAVGDLEAAVDWAIGQLGCRLRELRETRGEASGMRSAVLELGGLILVLVQGTSASSQVAQFVARHGPGVQHLALRVSDITQASSALARRGMHFSTPQLDGDDLSQIFSTRDPRTGLMLELIQRHNGYLGFSDENVTRLFRSLEQRGEY